MTSIAALGEVEQQREIGAQPHAGFACPTTRARRPAARRPARRTGRSSRASDRARHRSRSSRFAAARKRAIDIALVEQDARRRWIGAQRRLRCPTRSGGSGLRAIRRAAPASPLPPAPRARRRRRRSRRRRPSRRGREMSRSRLHRPRSGSCRHARRHRRRHKAGARRGHAACRARACRGHRRVRRSPWPEDRRAAPTAPTMRMLRGGLDATSSASARRMRARRRSVRHSSRGDCRRPARTRPSLDHEIGGRDAEAVRRTRDQEMPRLRGGAPQRPGAELDRLAGDGRALIGRDGAVSPSTIVDARRRTRRALRRRSAPARCGCPCRDRHGR